jgi:hypothetical protein
MEPVLFVMAILGCGESEAPCHELGIVRARYQSEAACLAATETELTRRDDILYPSVVAQCRPAGARPRLVRGDTFLMPEPESNRLYPVRVASRR